MVLVMVAFVVVEIGVVVEVVVDLFDSEVVGTGVSFFVILVIAVVIP